LLRSHPTDADGGIAPLQEVSMSSSDPHHRPGRRRRGAESCSWGRRAIALGTAVVLALAMGLAAGSALAVKKGPPPKAAPAKSVVFPPSSHPYGLSYSEWSGAWWEFTLAIPNFDPTSEGHPPNCRPSGDKHVYFLVGIFSPTDRIDCVLPAGTALFLPVLNVDCSSVEAPPFFGATAREQRACATALFDQTEGIAAEIDGREVPNILRFRVVSPQFSIAPLPADNRLGVPAGRSGTGVADGVYLMVKPLRVGEHTIRITGTFTVPGLSFSLDTTIDIVVTPRK
jgi:hypothetical protein